MNTIEVLAIIGGVLVLKDLPHNWSLFIGGCMLTLSGIFGLLLEILK